jgi:putative phosphoesterase
MKIALLSDIHGNLPALQAVLDSLQSFQPDILAVAGDLTGGPYSNEVIHLLLDREAVMILGNSDLGLLRYKRGDAPREWQTSKQFGLSRWNARNLSDINFQILFDLPEQSVIKPPGVDPIHIVHGTPRDPYEAIYPDRDLSLLDLSLQMIDQLVLVCGHTHEQWYLRRNGKIAVNPGSVAGPLNGVVGAQCALIDWKDNQWQVELLTVPYNLDPLRIAFHESGLLREGGPIARAFLLSHETGRNVSLDFLTYAFQLAEKAGFKNCQVLPDEIYDLAGATFSWETYLAIIPAPGHKIGEQT